MKEVFKAAAVLSSATFANMFAGFVRSKFTALILGVVGVGLFSQAFNFLQFAVTVSSLSMRIGIMRYIAKYTASKDYKKTKQVIATALLFQIISAVVILIIIAFNASLASKCLFGSDKFKTFIFLVILNIPVMVLSGIFESLIIGFGDYKNFTKAKVLSTFLSIAPLLIFVGIMKMNGAFIYLIASSVISLLMFYFIARRSLPKEVTEGMFDFKKIFSEKQDILEIVRHIFSYSGVSFITSAVSLLLVVVMRSMVVNKFGLEANGFYQVVFSISAYYLAFYTNSIWSYFYPKASALSGNEAEYADEINKTLRFCVLGAMPFIIGIYLFRYQAIQILFSKNFIPSSELFQLQLSGDLFYLIFYIFGTSLMARGHLKAYVISNLGYNASFIGLFIFASPYLGLKSIVLAYAAANFMWALALWFYHNRFMEARIVSKNRFLVIISVSLIVFLLFMDASPIVSACKSVLAVVCLYFTLTEIERKKMHQLIITKVSKLFR